MPASTDRSFCFRPARALFLTILLGACHHSTTPPAAIASITIAAPSDYLVMGSTLQLTATAQDAGGHVLTDRSLTWTSSNPSVLTVNSEGLTSAVAYGKATVSVSAEGKFSSVDLMVTVLSVIRVTAESFVLQPGAMTRLTAVVVDSANHEVSTPVSWSSDDQAIATVSASGRVAALAEGVTVISATAGSIKAEIPIQVQQPVTGKIAFVSKRGPIQQTPVPTQQGGIYLMNPDGTQQQLVLPDPFGRCNPDPGGYVDMCYIHWKQPMLASDGLHLAAVRWTIYDIEYAGDMIYECATGGLCIKVDYPAQPPRPAPIVALAGVSDPAWSPDARSIAFGADGIWMWDSATGVVSNVLGTTPVAGAQPTWSPDGKRLALVQGDDIWVVNLDGSHLVNLTNRAGQSSQPAWSPDGARIAFVSNRDGNDEIYAMYVDGSAPINLTHDDASDEHPTWSPDSMKIAFQTNRDGNNEIYAMYADGSNQVNLTNDPAEDTSPSWGP
jgi:hypothetical protein